MILATIFMLLFSTSAASARVMWGKTELKEGQIGKVTILTNVNATKIKGNTLIQDKRLKKGEEFRVYSYRVVGDSGYYGLGGGLFVQKSTRVKYETPSKAKLGQLAEEKVIKLINAERRSYGLNPLTTSAKLNSVAKVKSTDMKNNRDLSLYSPTYGDPDDMLDYFNVPYYSWAIVIGGDYHSPEDVVYGWITDYDLNQYIFDPYMTHIGVGYERDGGYWTAFFIE